MLDAQSANKGERVENDEVLDGEKEKEESREDFSKLKVVELRSRLQEAGLNCRGTKSVLVERLTQASKEKKNEDKEETEEMEEPESHTTDVGEVAADGDVQMQDETVTIEDVPDEDGTAVIPESNEEEEAEVEEEEA